MLEEYNEARNQHILSTNSENSMMLKEIHEIEKGHLALILPNLSVMYENVIIINFPQIPYDKLCALFFTSRIYIYMYFHFNPGKLEFL